MRSSLDPVVMVAAPPPPRLSVGFCIEAVPVVAPMVRAAAALPKLIVVAVVSRRSNDVEPVVRDVEIAGDVLNTATPPEPVSSVRVSDRTEDNPE